MRKIAISDIHGHAQTFRTLVQDVLKLTREDQLYLLGDYIDRGPDSRGVLDYIMELKEAGYELTCLKGNHEAMMADSLWGGGELELWLTNGGLATLKSFGVQQPGKIPQQYHDFLHSLEYVVEVDQYILVHAGLNFSKENPLNPVEEMLWIRWWYETLDYEWLGDRFIIHGHTPMGLQDIQRMYNRLHQNRFLDIDNGCFAGFNPGMGQLCAFDMTRQKLYFQENVD